MKIYTFQRTQKLPISLSEAWEFLSNPKNLSILTPTEMNFTIISKDEKPMYAGQVIQYSVTPIAGIKATWISEITHLEEGKYFVDLQLYGPYAFWHHKHFIHEIDGGVEMEDIIDYKVPFGIFGRIFHPLLVKPKLEKIFSYRQKKLVEIFGKYLNNG
jgi:ligand-binding SRPBCC domain-containing protein